MRAWTTGFVLLFASAVFLAPSIARACKCGPPSPTVVSQPRLVPGDEPSVEWLSARVDIRCESDKSCTWRSIHRVRNTGEAQVDTLAIVLSHAASELRLDGTPLATASAQTRGQLRLGRPEHDEDWKGHLLVELGVWEDYGVHEFALSLAPGEEVAIEIAAELHPVGQSCGCGFWGVRARHLVATPRFDEDQRFGLADLGTRWARDAAVSMSLESKRKWSAHFQHDVGDAIHKRIPDKMVRHRATRSPAGSVWAWRNKDPKVLPGGPYAGVGMGFGTGVELRLRGGYEFAAPQYLTYGLSVESDASTHVEVIPAVGLVPPWGLVLSFMPMPALEIGAPVQVWPSTRAGFRAGLSVGWFFFTILGSFDVYPATPSLPQSLRGGLVFQLSM